VNRSWFPSWCEVAPIALLCVALASCAAAPSGPTFAFSHDTSVAGHWPFGLDDCTTKIVAKPAPAGDSAASYWVVRSTAAVDVELTAVVTIRPEFPGTPFAPVRGVDYECITGADRNGATTTELAPDQLEIHIPPQPGARQSGFVLRARFPGGATPQQPPKSLLIEIVRIVDAQGRSMHLGALRRARWLIVAPEAEPARRVEVESERR
jgi:hypothetical protein